MSQLTSASDYQKFADAVKSNYRYIQTPEIANFLGAIRCTAKLRVCPVSKNWMFWRAQRGGGLRLEQQDGMTFERESAYGPKRMKPRYAQAREGRANPKGISYLYGATDRATAMAEVRPGWLGALVSVGQFRLLHDIKIVDCSKFHAESPFSLLLDRPVGGSEYTPSAEEIEKAVWTDIDQAFSYPVMESDDLADYVPTQILTEVFKEQGYGGVAYKSMVTEDGYNLAFFDPRIAEQVSCRLHKVTKLIHEYSEHPEDEYVVDENSNIVRSEIVTIKGIPKLQ